MKPIVINLNPPIKGNLIYEDESKEKVIFVEDAINGRFTIRLRSEGETTYALGIDPYK